MHRWFFVPWSLTNQDESVCVEDVYCVVSGAGRASGHYGQTCKHCFIMFGIESTILSGNIVSL